MRYGQYIRFAFLAAALALMPAYAADPGEGAILSAASADTVVWRGGEPIAARAGMQLALGDEVETKSQGRAVVRYPQGHEVALRPATRFSAERLLLRFGELLVRARGWFRVDTVFMQAGVEGTEFSVRARESSQTANVVVIEGAVVCSSKDNAFDRVRVAEGERLDVLVTRGGLEAVKRAAAEDEIKELRALFGEFGGK